MVYIIQKLHSLPLSYALIIYPF